MNTEYRLRRLERTLGTLISWSQIELGLHNTNALLDMLNASEAPDLVEAVALNDPTYKGSKAYQNPTPVIVPLDNP